MRRRAGGLLAVAVALLACLVASPAPAVSAPAHPVTGAEWHRLHPTMCHTVGDHEPLSF
jgi:hypothetical protein